MSTNLPKDTEKLPSSPTPVLPSSIPVLTPGPTPEPSPAPLLPRYDFDSLKKEYGNENIVGYLKIEGTTIDYPIVQSGDNEYYLAYNIYEEKDVAGWIFMDYENDVCREDKNSVIYGHNMKKDYMFHALRRYQDKNFWAEHKYIIFDTPERRDTWEIFSFYKTDTDFYYIQVLFEDEGSFFDLASQMKEYSLYDTGVGIDRSDRILTLSTCTGDSPDSRYVLNARLVTDLNSLPAEYR